MCQHAVVIVTPYAHSILSYLEHKPLTGGLEQSPEFGFGPLLSVKKSQHHKVHATHDALIPGVLLTWLKKAVVIDNDSRPGLKSWDQILENLNSIRSGIIVNNPAEVVN
jgi:hypothetical protein